MGFLVLGILAGTDNGYSSAMFYVLTYALMTLGVFGMILLLVRARASRPRTSTTGRA